MKRERVLFVRLSDDEQEIITTAARMRGLPAAVYTRMVLLDAARDLQASKPRGKNGRHSS